MNFLIFFLNIFWFL